MTSEDERICFVIAPIGEPDSDIRKRSDQVLRYLIAPAVEHKGYTAVRADELDKPGMITSQVIQHVVEDPLVIADLTGRNPNVFYELAIRHAIRKPIVQIISKGENIPFDVAGTRTIFVDHHDLDNVAQAKESILEQIDALEADSSDLETPISVSLDLQRLRQSENPEQRSLADMVSLLSEIQNGLSTLDANLMTQVLVSQSELLTRMGEMQAFLHALRRDQQHSRLSSDEIRARTYLSPSRAPSAAGPKVVPPSRESSGESTDKSLDELPW